MSPLDWFKKERPMLSMQSFGGGAAGLMISGAPPAIDASGGVKTTPGDGYVYHIFGTGGPSTFAVAAAGKGPDGVIDLCVVGGGGGGSLDNGGGGGAGGFRITTVDIASYGDGNYPITLGGGGPGQPTGTPGPTRPPAVPGDPSSFNIPASISPSPISITCGGGGGAGPISPTPSPTQTQSVGRPGLPYPFPTNSPPHPNSIVFPGSGGGARQQGPSAGDGAGAPFNSSPGTRGSSGSGGGGGGAGETGFSPTSGGAAGGQGKQLPWALPTWGWGENNDAGLSGQAPTSPTPNRPAGPGGQLPWGYGWFAGGGGGGRETPGGPTSYWGLGKAGGGNGNTDGGTYGGPPSTGSDGFGYWAAPNTGSGGGGAGNSGSPTVPGAAGKGGSGVVMLRYPVG